jgi:hypothetical protein
MVAVLSALLHLAIVVLIAGQRVVVQQVLLVVQHGGQTTLPLKTQALLLFQGVQAGTLSL